MKYENKIPKWINDSQDIINSGSKQKKIGDHFGVDISFLRLYNYIYLQSSNRNKRAKGYQV